MDFGFAVLIRVDSWFLLFANNWNHESARINTKKPKSNHTLHPVIPVSSLSNLFEFYSDSYILCIKRASRGDIVVPLIMARASRKTVISFSPAIKRTRYSLCFTSVRFFNFSASSANRVRWLFGGVICTASRPQNTAENSALPASRNSKSRRPQSSQSLFGSELDFAPVVLPDVDLHQRLVKLLFFPVRIFSASVIWTAETLAIIG